MKEEYYAVLMTSKKRDEWEHPLYFTMSRSRRNAINAFLVSGVGARFIDKEKPWQAARKEGFKTILLTVTWNKDNTPTPPEMDDED